MKKHRGRFSGFRGIQRTGPVLTENGGRAIAFATGIKNRPCIYGKWPIPAPRITTPFEPFLCLRERDVRRSARRRR